MAALLIDHYASPGSPGDQQVFLLQEKDLSDSILVSFQPVQTALIDDIPHDDICILKQTECLHGTGICLCKTSTSTMRLKRLSESTPSHSEFECQGWLMQVTCLPQRYIQTNKCISAPAWVAFAIPDITSFFILTVLLAPHSCPAAPARLPTLGSPTPSLSCSPNSSHCYSLPIGRGHTAHLKYQTF